jgi:hypothetical protein
MPEKLLCVSPVFATEDPRSTNLHRAENFGAPQNIVPNKLNFR